jgi:hypothetical protein
MRSSSPTGRDELRRGDTVSALGHTVILQPGGFAESGDERELNNRKLIADVQTSTIVTEGCETVNALLLTMPGTKPR